MAGTMLESASAHKRPGAATPNPAKPMHLPEPRILSLDPALEARIVRCTPLRYSDGADPLDDRPAHVRAASAIARTDGRLAVVQDDANWIALLDPRSGRVDALPLPTDADGRRLFDDRRGNKHHKMDLEACTVVPGEGGDVLLAWGSGSTPLRERIVQVRGWGGTAPEVRVVDAAPLYAALRAQTAFSGSELNVEGAVWLGDRVRLFNRGNGAPRAGLLPTDATCDLAWPALWSYLQDPAAAPPPLPGGVVRYALETLGGVPLTFTDAATGPGGAVFFCAAAEDSPDAVLDGPVAGSAIGVLRADGSGEWTAIRDAGGRVFDGKVEGLLLPPEASGRALVVVDRDDPDRASELCEVELRGAWAV